MKEDTGEIFKGRPFLFEQNNLVEALKCSLRVTFRVCLNQEQRSPTAKSNPPGHPKVLAAGLAAKQELALTSFYPAFLSPSYHVDGPDLYPDRK